ncbi:MAG: glycosyltransferase family 39 protein [Flavobacteriales bacterium]|nr:glycosyltransferase family 39 protein [Flavobacteriales bacterium]
MEWRAHIRRYGIAALPGEPWMRTAFLILLALAAVLRFWDLPHLPYTHDELSALIRIYPTLGETIREGVVALDTHPPGVQVFEWLWTRAFSMEEADVKLPFIAMGLVAIFLLYRFALAWTGAGAALVLVTLMATLQYSVFYGQLARPYAAGLFTTALLADQLTRFVAFGHRRALIGVGIAAALSAYTHHFSLMLAALMVASGLLLLERSQRRSYLVMCGIAAALYLPNIPILLKQLGLGGLGNWLPPPGHDWLARYGSYITHDSPALAVLLIGLILASVMLVLRDGGAVGPARWLLLLWGALPLAIGFGYSVWRAPVLQYSVVLFSFPYLALFLVQGVMHIPRKAVLIGAGLLAIVSVHTLVHSRKHYTVTYHSKYEAMLRAGLATVEERGADGVLVLLDMPGNVEGFYRRLWNLREDRMASVNIHEGWEQARVDSLLALYSGKLVVYGRVNGAQPENLALVQPRFPRMIDRQDLAEGQVFRFTDAPVLLERFDRDTIAHLGSDTIGAWSIEPSLPLLLEGGWDYSGREFGLLIELPLDSIVLEQGDQVEVTALVDGWSADTDASIVADVQAGGQSIFYRGGRLDPLQRAPGLAVLTVTISPADIAPQVDQRMLRAYLYSPAKGPLHVRTITLMRREVNRVRDAVLSPVPWLGRFPPE